jgi:hypothetical protein
MQSRRPGQIAAGQVDPFFLEIGRQDLKLKCYDDDDYYFDKISRRL